MSNRPFLGLLSASKSHEPAVTHDIGSRDPLRRFHTRAVFTEGSTGHVKWRGELSCG
jgi:hypothetical protein